MTREDWLKERQQGLGASDAAAILGLSNWKSSDALWETKTGQAQPDDISDNPFVQYGIAAEPLLRELFKLDYANVYTVDYEEYKIVKNAEYPFIFATLDGELAEIATGRKGVLEIKTAEIMNAGQWMQWKDRIPDSYYVQLCHALLATGFDFAVLKAQIKYHKDGVLNIATRHYHIERNEVEDDIELLKKECIKFWQSVESNERPPLKLPPI